MSVDAELIGLCVLFVGAHREYCAVARHTDDLLLTDPEWIRCDKIARALVPKLHASVREIASRAAQTPEGIWWKAEAARHWLAGDVDVNNEPSDAVEDALIWSLVQDVVGRART